MDLNTQSIKYCKQALDHAQILVVTAVLLVQYKACPVSSQDTKKLHRKLLAGVICTAAALATRVPI